MNRPLLSTQSSLQECENMPIHERCKFGGAEGYNAKVRELEAIVIEVNPSGCEWKTMPFAMQRSTLMDRFEDAHARAD